MKIKENNWNISFEYFWQTVFVEDNEDIVDEIHLKYHKEALAILSIHIELVFVVPINNGSLCTWTFSFKYLYTWFLVAENDELTGRNGTTCKGNNALSTWVYHTEKMKSDGCSRSKTNQISARIYFFLIHVDQLHQIYPLLNLQRAH